MSKSKLFGPGANALLNGVYTQCTSLFATPSRPATAYATADSKPFAVLGSLIFHDEPFGEPPPNHGGYAGLSVPIVRLPSSTRFSVSFGQPATAVRDACDGPDANAAVTPSATSAAAAIRIFLMRSNPPVRDPDAQRNEP